MAEKAISLERSKEIIDYYLDLAKNEFANRYEIRKEFKNKSLLTYGFLTGIVGALFLYQSETRSFYDLFIELDSILIFIFALFLGIGFIFSILIILNSRFAGLTVANNDLNANTHFFYNSSTNGLLYYRLPYIDDSSDLQKIQEFQDTFDLTVDSMYYCKVQSIHAHSFASADLRKRMKRLNIYFSISTSLTAICIVFSVLVLIGFIN